MPEDPNQPIPEPDDRTAPDDGTRTAERSVLDEPAADDRDEAWGDREPGRDDDWYQRERPPHHG